MGSPSVPLLDNPQGASMILRPSRTPSQVTPASVSLSHVVTDTGQLPAYLSWARRPCVDGTGFDTCRHLGCRRPFGRSGSEIASPSIAWDSSRRSGIPCRGQDCYCKKSFVRGLQSHSRPRFASPATSRTGPPSVVTEHPIREVFCIRSPETQSKSAGY